MEQDDRVIGKLLTLMLEHMYSYVLLGAVMLFVLDRNKGREPFSVFRAINIVTRHPIVLTLDILVSCALGGLVVYLLTDPKTIQQAIVTGLGTTGILSTFGKVPSVSGSEPGI
ncbi:hypothetical protein [Jiella avicenniae]|uniref:Uncharacterized protein n=1 Tax=Jiella avicenniae TaxID=2907202 RepID=A0A9X1P102_9HYPH|nr:hypothetical protein [Jiella avicenniae]MCE7028355.1 hypothetical protein [Jiella avicenniae]